MKIPSTHRLVRTGSLAAALATLLASHAVFAATQYSAGTCTHDNGVTVSMVTNDAAPDDITVRIPRSNAAPGNKLFARLKATQP